MIALTKSEPMSESDASDVRPIGVGNCKRRAWSSQLMSDKKGMFERSLSPQQMAAGVKSGQQKMFTAVDIHMTHPQHEHHVVGESDMSNAFNDTERAAILESFLEHNQWHELYPVLWSTVSPACRIKGMSETTASDDGVVQGDPPSTPAFCCTTHEDVVWVDTQLRRVGGFTMFFADDGRFVDPPHTVHTVMQEFENRMRRRLNLHHDKRKCKLWFQDVASMRAFKRSVPVCECPINLCGTMVAGVPLGSAQHVQNELEEIIDTVLSESKTIAKMLRGDSLQNLYSILVHCCNARV